MEGFALGLAFGTEAKDYSGIAIKICKINGVLP